MNSTRFADLTESLSRGVAQGEGRALGSGPREDNGRPRGNVGAIQAGRNNISQFKGFCVRATHYAVRPAGVQLDYVGAFEVRLREQAGGASEVLTPRSVPGARATERYRSGQTGQTVNLLSIDFGGSNPPLSTTEHR